VEISLRYVTHFVYTSPVWESHNSLRAKPVHGDGQQLLEYEVSIDPSVPIFSYLDNWGTHVDTFDIPQQHDELVVVAFARVDTTAPYLPISGPLAGTAEMSYIEDGWRFLQPTRHTRWGEEVAAAAKGALGASTDVLEIVDSVEAIVRDRIEYRTGATEIGVDINLLWNERVGVCQDFAHLTIAMLRSLGIASRYVSGYFYASDPSAGEMSETDEILVATHAWVEVAVPGWGWWAIDPTNVGPVGDRHVKIGHGRDYDDVTPLRGVYYGESAHHLAAAVTMSTSRILSRAIPEVAATDEWAAQQ
jgi:transglutaminase-like putative cysteine protease